MKIGKGRAATALGLGLAMAAIAPAVAANASTYQDFYNLNCGSIAYVQIKSTTSGDTDHYRNGLPSFHWAGGSSPVSHTSQGNHSITTASVETSGPYAWVYSASISCWTP